MDTPNLYFQESEFSTKPKSSKGHLQKVNGISFWAFILSSLVYISIFYIFNLSPSTLFTTTKFWFFISNTLILIIAADFGAFTSSTKHDLYEDYPKNVGNSAPYTTQLELDLHLRKNIREKNVWSFEYNQHPKIEEKIIPQVGIENTEEQIKAVIVVHASKRNVQQPVDKVSPCVVPQETKIDIAVKNEPKKKIELIPKAYNEAREKKKTEYSRCVRSKSDRKITFGYDEKKNQNIVPGQTETEKHETSAQENEFTTMSNEELNRRIEDFIRKFNMQIRLQATRNRQSLEVH